MTKSKITRDKEAKIASWLFDSYSNDNEVESDFRPDARDLINYLKANGWELRQSYESKEMQQM